MRYLLDTHAYLWAVDDSSRLSRRALEIIEGEANDLVLSIASLWEIAIKLSIGKLKTRPTFEELAVVTPAARGVTILPITPEHLDFVIQLSLHHRDPFDRLLIAQGDTEGIPILSRDTAFDRYNIVRVW
jgi:PIN domain nuclease of toxin-antitoxin system